MTTDARATLDELLTACQVLDAEGLAEAFGHVSVRTGAQRIAITPREPLVTVRSHDDLVDVTWSEQPLWLPPEAPPETYLHTAVYAARRDVAAVVRFHAPFTLALSTVESSFRPTIGYGAYLGLPPVHDDPRLVRSDDAGRRSAAVLGQSAALILRGNGAITVGASVREATVRALFLERSAAAACRAGVGVARALDDQEIDSFVNLPDARTAQIERAWRYYAGKVARR